MATGGGAAPAGTFTGPQVSRNAQRRLSPRFMAEQLATRHYQLPADDPGFDTVVEAISWLYYPELLARYIQHAAGDELFPDLFGFEGAEAEQLLLEVDPDAPPFSTITVTKALTNSQFSIKTQQLLWSMLAETAAPLTASRKDKRRPFTYDPFGPAKTFVVDCSLARVAQEWGAIPEDVRPTHTYYKGRSLTTILASNFLTAPLGHDGEGEPFDNMRAMWRCVSPGEGDEGLVGSWTSAEVLAKNERHVPQATGQCLVLAFGARLHGIVAGKPVAEKVPVRFGGGLKWRWLEDVSSMNQDGRRKSPRPIPRSSAASSSSADMASGSVGHVVDEDDAMSVDEEEGEGEGEEEGEEGEEEEEEEGAAATARSKKTTKRRRLQPWQRPAIAGASPPPPAIRVFIPGLDDPPPCALADDDDEGALDAVAVANGEGEENLDLGVEDEEGGSERCHVRAQATARIKGRLSDSDMRGAPLQASGLSTQAQPTACAALQAFHADLPWNTLPAMYLDLCADAVSIIDCLQPPAEERQCYIDAVEVGLVGVLHVLKAVFDALPLSVRKSFEDALRGLQRKHGMADDPEDALITDSSAFFLYLTPPLREFVERRPDDGLVPFLLDVKAMVIGIVTSYPTARHLVYDAQGRPIPGLRTWFVQRFRDGQWQPSWMVQQFIAAGVDGQVVKKTARGVVLSAPIGKLAFPSYPVKDGLGIRVSGTLEVRTLSEVVQGRGFKAIIRDLRLGAVLAEVTGGEAARMILTGMRYGTTLEARCELRTLFRQTVTDSDFHAGACISYLDRLMQQFLMAKLHVAKEHLTHRICSVAQLKAFLQQGVVEGVQAGPTFGAFIHADYARGRASMVSDGCFRSKLTSLIRALALDYPRIEPDGRPLTRGLHERYHDPLLDYAKAHFTSWKCPLRAAHLVLNAVNVTDDMSAEDIKGLLEAKEACHDARRWTDAEMGTVVQGMMRCGLGLAWAFFCRPADPVTWVLGRKGRGIKTVETRDAVDPDILAGFAIHLEAAELEPNFKNVVCLALGALGARPTWMQAELTQFLRKGKAEHCDRDFSLEDCGNWTSQLAMQAALGHMREFLGVN